MLADVAVILFLVGCVLVGFFRGSLRQLLALGAWLIAFTVAAQGRAFIADWLRGQRPDFTANYALMLGFVIGFAVILLAALALIELTGRTTTLSNSAIVDDLAGAGLMLLFGILALSGLLIALGTYFTAANGSAEVDLVRQLYAALLDSKIVGVLRETLVPWIQFLLGPILPPDVRHFG